MMHFTDEEKIKLKKCRNEIVAWIEQNIVPNLEKDESIRYNFGGMYYARNSYDTKGTANYHFTVWDKPILIFNAFSSIVGKSEITFSEKYGHNQDFRGNDIFYNDIFVVVNEWGAIKSYLLRELRRLQDAREENSKKIMDFTV